MVDRAPVKHVLVVGRRRMELVRMMSADPRIRMSLITEPACRDLYPEMRHVELVDDVQQLDDVRRAALAIADREPFEAIVAPGESSIPTAGYLRSYFGLPGIPFDVAHAFCNKAAMKAVLRRAGIAVAGSSLVPRAESLPTVALRHGLPAVVKPVWFDGSAHVYKIRDVADLARVADPEGPLLPEIAPPYLVEDLLELEAEFHCDGLVRDGQVVFAATSRYLIPSLDSMGAVFGSFTLSEGPEHEELVRLHREVVSALGLRDSVTHLEVFRTGGRWVVGEIACRPGGSGIPTNLRAAHDFDTWSHFLATELNEPLPWRPTSSGRCHLWVMFPVRHGVVATVPGSDVFADVEAVDRLEVKVRPGDVIDGQLYSSSMSAVAHCSLPDEDGVPALVELLASRFEVTYADQDGIPPSTGGSATGSPSTGAALRPSSQEKGNA